MVTAKKVAKNASIYGIVQILQGAIGFFLLPIYTRYLTPNDYGIISVVGSITTFLTVFYFLGLHISIQKFYIEYSNKENELNDFISTIITAIIGLSIILTLIFVITHKVMLDRFLTGIPFYPYMLLGVVASGFSTLFVVYQNFMQVENKAKDFAIQKFVVFLINLSLNIIFVVNLKLQAKGPLLASMIVGIITFFYVLFKIKGKFKLKINKVMLNRSLRYSLPLVPHSLASWAFNLADRLILSNLKTPAMAGIYNIGYQFGNIICIVSDSVYQAFIPWFFSAIKNNSEDTIKKSAKMVLIFTTLYSIGAMFLSLFGGIILKFMVHKSFISAFTVIPYISFSYAFNGVYCFSAAIIFYDEKATKILPVITMLTSILNILMNFMLIPKFNIMGSAISTLIPSIFGAVITVMFSLKLFKIYNVNWSFKKMFFIVSLAFIITLFSMNLNVVFKLGEIIIFILISTKIIGLKYSEIKKMLIGVK